jgi:hypothetical protein
MTQTLDAVVADFVTSAVEARIGEIHRPELVTQRTVTAVVGMPKRDFLGHCRARDWPCWVDGRLRYAKTADVVAWIMAHPMIPLPSPDDAEARAFARSRSLIRRATPSEPPDGLSKRIDASLGIHVKKR